MARITAVVGKIPLFTNSVLAENSLDHHKMDEDDTPVEKAATKCTKELEIPDKYVAWRILRRCGLLKYDQYHIELPFEVESSHILHIRNYHNDATYSQDCLKKLRYLTKQYSSNSVERRHLFRSVMKYDEIERHRSKRRKIFKWNHQHFELKIFWDGKRQPAGKKTATKDVFDMSSLGECLPSTPCGIKKKEKKLAKIYLSYQEKSMEAFRTSEIIRILSSNILQEKNSNCCCSEDQSESLTRIMKKVYGDVKNVTVFSFRPTRKKGSDQPRILGSERIVILKYSIDETFDRSKLKDWSSAANNPGNSAHLPFRKHQQDDEQEKSAALRREQLSDSILLSRQLSRMKLTNSRRGDLSLDMNESEIQEQDLCTNKKSIIKKNLKFGVVEDLRGFYRRDANRNKDQKTAEKLNKIMREVLELQKLVEFYKMNASSIKPKNETEEIP